MKSSRGFASMDPAKQKEIAGKGGRAAHLKGTGHKFSPEEAREAGRKGAAASLAKRRQIQHEKDTGMRKLYPDSNEVSQ